MSYTPEQTLVARPLVLGWAATMAYAQPISAVVQRGLLLMFQQAYNAPALQAMIRLGAPTLAGRIAEDSTWGAQTVKALCVVLLMGSTRPNVERAGVIAAFDIANRGAAIATLAKLQQRFTALRDSMQVASDSAHGVYDGVSSRATSLLDLVRNAPTTADVAQRAEPYLASLGETGTPSSGSTATTVVSTRTPPSTKFLNEATQTPSTTPDVLAPEVHMEFTDGARVPGRVFASRAPLAIIIPSVLVGGLFLIWGFQKYQGRSRR